MFSDPVVGSLFFGREEILETLKKRVDAHRDGYRQNLALIGEERLGKTSIIQHYLHSAHDRRVLPVYVDLTHQTIETFLHHFCHTLLFQALVGADEGENAVAAASWDALVERAQTVCPRTVAEVRTVLAFVQNAEWDRAYAAALELPSCAYRETGRRCVVILDEFHRLGDFPVKHAFQIFGKRLMVQKDTQYILLSSSVRLSREILAQKLALLFGHFERIDLGPFDFATADRFIQRHLEPAALDAPTRRFLAVLTDGHPFYLNVLTQRLREESERQLTGRISRSMIFSAFKRTLFDADGILNQCFVKRLSRWMDVRSTGSYRQMLFELARGTRRLKDLAAKTGRSQAECSRQLAALTEDEILVKNGALYSFADPLFRFWVTAVVRHRDLSLLVDAPSRASLFIKDLEEELERFLAADAQPDAARISHLLGCFEGDRVEWDGRSRQLPVLDDIRSLSASADSARFTAAGACAPWEIRSFSRAVTEADVRSLAGETRLQRPKPKTLLIHIAGMDPNAKLMAKNLNIWVVGLRQLNFLMALHQQPKCVRLPDSAPAAPAEIPALPVNA